MFEKFDDEARLALEHAANEARRLYQRRASSVHVLLALLRDGQAELARLFEVVGVTRETIGMWVVEEMGFTVGALPDHISTTDDVHQLVERANREAQERGSDVRPPDLVLTMLADPNNPVRALLRSSNVDQRELSSRIRRQFAH
jgi:ATP-dependent Clp protease ATP-binding subunit ClpA